MHITWLGRRTWASNTCAVDLIPKQKTPRAIFTTIEIAQEASVVQHRCVTADHGYRGVNITIGSTEVLDVTIWATSSVEKDKSFRLTLDRVQLAKRFMPAVSCDDADGPSNLCCFSLPVNLIPIPRNCMTAVNTFLHKSPPDVRETWYGRREWSYYGCSMLLVQGPL